MRFVRHLAAVLLTVAVVVAIGMAWGHGSGAGGLAAPVRAHLTHLAKAKHLRIVLARRDSGPGLSLSNAGVLMHTAVIEAVIAAAVITASALRRHRRRMTRRTSLPAPGKSTASAR